METNCDTVVTWANKILCELNKLETNTELEKSIIIAETINNMFESYEKNFVSNIVIIGEQSSGKSTLCNNLITYPVLSTKSVFCTKVRTLIHLKYKQQNSDDIVKATLKYSEQVYENEPIEKIRSHYDTITTLLKDIDSVNIADISIYHNDPKLNISLVDNPGLNSTHDEDTLKCSQNSIDDYLCNNASLSSLVICSPTSLDKESQRAYALDFSEMKSDVYFVFTKMDSFSEYDKVTTFLKENGKYIEDKEYSVIDIMTSWGEDYSKFVIYNKKYKGEHKLNIKVTFIALPDEFYQPTTHKSFKDYRISCIEKEKDVQEAILQRLFDIDAWKKNGINIISSEDEKEKAREILGINKLYTELLDVTYDNILRNEKKIINDLMHKENEITAKIEEINIMKEISLSRIIEQFTETFSSTYNTSVTSSVDIKIEEDEAYDLCEEEKMCKNLGVGESFPVDFKLEEEKEYEKDYSLSVIIPRFISNYAKRTGYINIRTLKKKDLSPPIEGQGNIHNMYISLIDESNKEYEKIYKHGNKFVGERVGFYFLKYAQTIYNAILNSNSLFSSILENKSDVLLNCLKYDTIKLHDIENLHRHSYINRGKKITSFDEILRTYDNIHDRNIHNITNDIAKAIVASFYIHTKNAIIKDIEQQWNPSQKSQAAYNIILLEFASAFIHSDDTAIKLYCKKNPELDIEKMYTEIYKDLKRTVDEHSSNTAKNLNTAADKYEKLEQPVKVVINAVSSVVPHVGILPPLISLGPLILRGLAKAFSYSNTNESNYKSNFLYSIINLERTPDVAMLQQYGNNNFSDDELILYNYVFKRRMTASIFHTFISTTGIVHKHMYKYTKTDGKQFIMYQITSRLTSIMLGYNYPYEALERPNNHLNPMNIIPFIYDFIDYIRSKYEYKHENHEDIHMLDSDKKFADSPLFKQLSTMITGNNEKNIQKAIGQIENLKDKWNSICIDNRNAKIEDIINMDRIVIKILAVPMYETYSSRKTTKELNTLNKHLDIIKKCKNILSDTYKYMTENKMKILELNR